MNARLIGIGLFVIAALVVLWLTLFSGGAPDPLSKAIHRLRPERVDVLAFVGGEKRLFVEDEAVKSLLLDKHGIVIDARKAGSIEMVTDQALLSQKPDLLWPASASAADLGKQRGLQPLKEDSVFSTPIVFFSWPAVAEALVKAGIAKPVAGSTTAFRVDTRALIEKVQRKTTWAALGLETIYGTMAIYSTDPRHSNSGNQFATLVAVMLAGGEREPDAIRAVLPEVAAIFRRMGYMEQSSFDLFDQYLRTGITAKPIVVGYENQLIEFAALNPAVWAAVANQPVQPVILYPEPTLFASHVGLAMSKKGIAALDALRDPAVLDLAWRSHGFRSGLAGAADASALPVAGVPGTVSQVIQPLSTELVEEILAALDKGR